jgi:hypothetical protein
MAMIKELQHTLTIRVAGGSEEKIHALCFKNNIFPQSIKQETVLDWWETVFTFDKKHIDIFKGLERVDKAHTSLYRMNEVKNKMYDLGRIIDDMESERDRTIYKLYFFTDAIKQLKEFKFSVENILEDHNKKR